MRRLPELGGQIAPYFAVAQIVFLMLFLAYFVLGVIAVCVDFEAMDCPCAEDSWIWYQCVVSLSLPLVSVSVSLSVSVLCRCRCRLRCRCVCLFCVCLYVSEVRKYTKRRRHAAR